MGGGHISEQQTIAILASMRRLWRFWQIPDSSAGVPNVQFSAAPLRRVDVAQPRMGSLAEGKGGEMVHVPFSAAVLASLSKGNLGSTWGTSVESAIQPVLCKYPDQGAPDCAHVPPLAM
ncbi:uncharacterized protein TrAtP1_005652 [Trichoderma atroviride]|uniref:uncharacterized protein n=1 Tax=Hypocrea atroviridis TaxID=63577 RepID=UPI003324CA75|nr:hypothetical protein TrAtP1_005652 [Trichoderma atroviride]